jgi:23S rRNA (guanine2445-N2)-methyltransferase / 23S rRNA (guanine2069-N7)-methyltransferase
MILFASSPKGVEDLLAQEIEAQGAASVRPIQAGVHFSGTLEVAYRLCLWSRVASRVFLHLAEFPAPTPEDLYAGCAAVPWTDHLSAAGTLAVDCSLSGSSLTHSHYAAQVVKDAVVDFFRRRTGRRPAVALTRPDIRLHLAVRHDLASLGLDLSGESLHRRAYRQRGGEAPLKENVAAAMLLRAGWPQIAAAGGPLADPMCGTGTLPIEAALMAADIAPGLLRRYFGFLGWKGHDPGLWRRLQAEAEERRRAGMPRIPPLFGWDVDEQAVEAARLNRRRAGLEGRIAIARRELAEAVPPAAAKLPAGLVAVNPPYGERMGEEQALRPLYRRLGELLLAHYAGWKAAVLTAHEELAFATGLRATRTHTLFNGPIRCRLAHFDIRPDRVLRRETPGPGGTAPPSPSMPPSGTQTAPRLPSPSLAAGGTSPSMAPAGEESPGARMPRPGVGTQAVMAGEESPGAQMLANRLKKNLRLLGGWARREDVHCYRVYDSDLPEYAAAIDLFENRWAHVQEYAPPAEIEPEKAARRLEELLRLVPPVLGVEPQNVFLKQRRRQKGARQYTRLASSGELHPVREDGYRFLVNFTDTLDTGLFLDHRITRRKIGELARGRSFLNLFAYTGTATVYAAGGGASSTVSVDLSNTHLEWAARNLELNGFAVGGSGAGSHRLIRAECLEWLERDRGRYGLIFLDPPTFSNSKAFAGSFEVQRDHARLIRMAVDRLEAEGILLFTNNYRRFRMDRDALADLPVEDITGATIPQDFQRNPRIHNCWLIRRAGGGVSFTDAR